MMSERFLLFTRWAHFSLTLYAIDLFCDFSLLMPSADLTKWGFRIYFLIFMAVGLAFFWREILAHFTRTWVYAIIFGWLLFTILAGINPQTGLVRWLLAIQLVLLIACFVAAIPSPALFHRLLFYGLAAIVVLNAAIYAVNPGFSVDERGGFAGVIGDKNLAGQFSILALIVSLFFTMAARKQSEVLFGAAVTVLSLILLIAAKSKTSIFLGIPAVALCAAYYFIILRNRRAAVLTLLALVLAFGGSLFWAGISLLTFDQIAYALKDVTLSGRTTIWNAVIILIGDRPWIGHGFGSFWQTTIDLNGLGSRTHLSEFEKWIDNAAVINQAHNGYLDLLLAIGIIGLLLVVGAYLLTLAKLQRLIRSSSFGAADKYAFMAIHCSIFAGLLNNALESTIFYSPFYSLGVVMVIQLVFANWWYDAARQAGRYSMAPAFPTSTGGPMVVPGYSRATAGVPGQAARS